MRVASDDKSVTLVIQLQLRHRNPVSAVIDDRLVTLQIQEGFMDYTTYCSTEMMKMEDDLPSQQ